MIQVQPATFVGMASVACCDVNREVNNSSNGLFHDLQVTELNLCA
jgi:hypothetical protein